VERLELEVEFSVGGRRNVLEGPDVGGARPGFGNHVEFVERFRTVDPYVEDAAGFAAAGLIVFAIQRFREVQPKFVIAGGERDIVGESAFAPALVDCGLTGAGYRMIV
jgi:hypothetical protein